MFGLKNCVQVCLILPVEPFDDISRDGMDE